MRPASVSKSLTGSAGLDVQRIDPEGNSLSIRLRYQVIQRNVPGNRVLLGPLEQTVEVGAS